MIPISGGWAQWDYQLGTFRADIFGRVYGSFTGDIPTLKDLEDILLTIEGVSLSDQDRADLEAQREQNLGSSN